jgi:hypothetical protein
MATTPSRWWSASHPLRGKLFERRPQLSPTPLESDVEVSKVDRLVPPSIGTQLIDGVALLDDQGDDKAKEKQSKGDGDLLKTIFLGLDPTPNIIIISDFYFVEGALGLVRLAQTMKATKKIEEWKSRITLSVMELMTY